MKPVSSADREREAQRDSDGGPRPDLAGLSGIRGQDAVVRVLRSAIAHERPHHAYLFDGPEGTGKALVARALMAALNCQSPPAPGDACGTCDSCSKLRAGTHPDWIVMDMTLAGLADEVEKLLKRLVYPPLEGRAQVVLLDPADQLAAPTAQTAANRLLKTLEEPRPRTHFVLVTTAASSLLQTIRSRCQRLRFAPLPDGLLREALLARGASPESADAIVPLSQGSLGRAVRLAADQEGLAKRRELADQLYLAARAGRATEIVATASDAGADREEAQEVLELLWLRLHGELRERLREAAGSDEGLGAPGVRRLLGGLRVVREAQGAIRRYTGAPLALERMSRHLHPAVAQVLEGGARSMPVGSR